MSKRHHRILLTGAAGNLGQVLRASLPAHCECLRISDKDGISNPSAHEETVICDLADPGACLALTKNVDMVVHMGGQSIEGTWESVLNSNIIGFYNIYEGCRKNGVQRLIWGSSNHAIGYYPRTEMIDASATPRPDTNTVFPKYTAKHSRNITGTNIISKAYPSASDPVLRNR